MPPTHVFKRRGYTVQQPPARLSTPTLVQDGVGILLHAVRHSVHASARRHAACVRSERRGHMRCDNTAALAPVASVKTMPACPCSPTRALAHLHTASAPHGLLPSAHLPPAHVQSRWRGQTHTDAASVQHGAINKKYYTHMIPQK
jgi:hypothetical protein